MHKLNPYANIPTIMTAEEIIEFAHVRSTKAGTKSSKRIPKVERVRLREISRLKEFSRQVKTKLKEAVEKYPTLEKLHPFYLELTEILVGIDKLKMALGAVYNCIPVINQITNNHLEAMKLSEAHKQMKRSRSAAKGRIASLLRSTSDNLEFLIEAKKTMSRLPGIIPNSPTMVCAGFPNVGKSTLVRVVSTAEPEVAYYPFTTRKVIVGHLKINNQSVQIVDTPGILDRPMSQRNEIEQEAIAALKYLAHVILFMMDPSEACGWPFEEQINLHREVKRMFPLNPLLVIFNKVDITPPEQLRAAREKMPNAYEIVALDGTGVENLMHEAMDHIDLESLDDLVREYVGDLSRQRADSMDS
ncbi:MAG: hypothetical protein BAJATHORv1_20286 [Candidatus Thorarchaeota archaeon]|nr:MAG: hypothetical protein BAJATHORv1_20286 [Candidatus Thorarchaeota archaeon]